MKRVGSAGRRTELALNRTYRTTHEKRCPVLVSVAISVLLEIKNNEGYLIFGTSVRTSQLPVGLL